MNDTSPVFNAFNRRGGSGVATEITRRLLYSIYAEVSDSTQTTKIGMFEFTVYIENQPRRWSDTQIPAGENRPKKAISL